MQRSRAALPTIGKEKAEVLLSTDAPPVIVCDFRCGVYVHTAVNNRIEAFETCCFHFRFLWLLAFNAAFAPWKAG